jgi:hypothetical protein
VGEICIPAGAMWELVEERSAPGRCLGFDSGGPLSSDEIIVFSRQIGNRRERWRDACDKHYWDLVDAYPSGIPR